MSAVLVGDGDALGLGWRPETAGLALARRDVRFVEVIAESLGCGHRLAPELELLVERGVPVVPHGVRLSLGGADPPDPARLAALAGAAERLAAPLVSEHIAFVRAGGLDAGHLLPVPRTRAALDVVVDNVRRARAELPVPLALEPIASLLAWPDAELDEPDFITDLLDRTGALLLLDVANVVVNAHNFGFDPLWFVERLPLERLAYVHIAGGIERDDGFRHDTHAHPVWSEALDLLTVVAGRVPEGVAVLLERDDRFPGPAELGAELDRVAAAVTRARAGARSGAP